MVDVVAITAIAAIGGPCRVSSGRSRRIGSGSSISGGGCIGAVCGCCCVHRGLNRAGNSDCLRNFLSSRNGDGVLSERTSSELEEAHPLN